MSTRARWVVLALAVVGGAILVYAEVRRPSASHIDGRRAQQAAELRRDAARATAERRWGDAIHALDRAAALDPEGDDAPDVRALRDDAVQGFGGPY